MVVIVEWVLIWVYQFVDKGVTDYFWLFLFIYIQVHALQENEMDIMQENGRNVELV